MCYEHGHYVVSFYRMSAEDTLLSVDDVSCLSQEECPLKLFSVVRYLQPPPNDLGNLRYNHHPLGLKLHV